MKQPIAIKVTRHKCPFCPRSWSSKKTAHSHVNRCWMDPDNRACKTCENFEPATHGGCGARAGCQCQDRGEECRAGVSLAGGIKAECPMWVAAVWLPSTEASS